MIPTRIIIILSSVMIPAMKPNKKYSGGDRLALCPGVLTLIDCTGHSVADDEMANKCVALHEYVPGSKDN